jgi:hypothetical protein
MLQYTALTRAAPGLETAWESVDRAADKFKIASWLCISGIRCGRDHGIKSPLNQALLPGFNNLMDTPRRDRYQRHDHGDRPVEPQTYSWTEKNLK